MKYLVLFFCGVVRQQVGKYFTRFANLHFLFPTPLYSPFADGSVYEPAKISGFKFPGWAAFLLVGGTFLYCPARFAVLTILICQRDQEIHLPFHRGGDGSPGLLVAVDGLYGDPQQLGHLLLGLVKLFAKMDELCAVHWDYREFDA
jgi:hypothetical protein